MAAKKQEEQPLDIDEFRIKPGEDVDLIKWDAGDTSEAPAGKKKSKKIEDDLDERLSNLQEMLYAEHKHKLLVILQAMDTGGKDGVIRRVFNGINPAGVRVAHFREPSEEEKERGFLWRAYKPIPAAGELVIYNRSHYEGVLVERVHKIVPEQVWKKRYGEIVEFENILVSEGIKILKFYLHITFEEQKERIMERLQDPTKEWKFSVDDIQERKLWPEYMKAYQDALKNTSTENSPWYVVPANHKWFRDLLVATTIVETLEAMNMHYPRLSIDPKSIKLK